jgi:hypothetical protein
MKEKNEKHKSSDRQSKFLCYFVFSLHPRDHRFFPDFYTLQQQVSSAVVNVVAPNFTLCYFFPAPSGSMIPAHYMLRTECCI